MMIMTPNKNGRTELDDGVSVPGRTPPARADDPHR